MQNILNYISAEAPLYQLACNELGLDIDRPMLMQGIPYVITDLDAYTKQEWPEGHNQAELTLKPWQVQGV